MLRTQRALGLMITVFLVSCQANSISLAEANDIRSAIREFTQSESFVPPQRFTLIDEWVRNGITTQLKEIFDAENHFDYRRTQWTESGETSQSEWWRFYDGAKTYDLKIDSFGVKTRTEEEGNTFDSEISYETTLLANWNTIDFFSTDLDSVTEDNEDSRNVYRSTGEGNLYYKLYIPVSGNPPTLMELLFDNYNLVRYAMTTTTASDLYTVDYQNVPTDYPDIQSFPLTSEDA